MKQTGERSVVVPVGKQSYDKSHALYVVAEGLAVDVMAVPSERPLQLHAGWLATLKKITELSTVTRSYSSVTCIDIMPLHDAAQKFNTGWFALRPLRAFARERGIVMKTELPHGGAPPEAQTTLVLPNCSRDTEIEIPRIEGQPAGPDTTFTFVSEVGLMVAATQAWLGLQLKQPVVSEAAPPQERPTLRIV